MSDFNEIQTEDLIKRMCELVSESRRLAKRNDEVVAEYERLHKELERRKGRLSFAASVGQGGTC
jgi:hypothetical protein